MKQKHDPQPFGIGAGEGAGVFPKIGWQSFVDISPDAILVTDAAGVIQCANAGAGELFGYKRAELIGSPIEVLVPQRLRLKHTSHRENFNAHPRTRRLGVASNLVGLHKDGTEIPVDILLKSIESPSGPLVLSFVRDMTEQRAAQETIHSRDLQLRSLIDGVKDHAIYLLDKEGYVTTWNPGAERLKQYMSEEIVGRHFSCFFTKEDRERGRPAQLMIIAAARGQVEEEGWRLRKDGSRFWANIVLTAIRNSTGELTGYAKVTRDFTDRKRVEEALALRFSDELQASSNALKASDARYRTVFQTSPDAVTISRLRDGIIVDVNQASLDITGYKRNEVLGKTTTQLRIWVNSRDRFKLVEVLRRDSQCRDIEAQFRRKDGGTFWARLSVSFIEIDGDPCILSFARDISAAKLAEEKIKDLAFYDPLTGLANRRLISERLSQSVLMGTRTHRKRALLFIDLDDFKTLNDTLGHHFGDLLLQEVARRLAGCVRESDTVGRLGGDEFVVMLEDLSEIPEIAASQARTVAEKILASTARPYELDGHQCRSGSSIGITLFGDNEKGVQDILQQADIAMYEAKKAGRNTISFFAPDLHVAVIARAIVEEELRQAIAKKQLELHYQPQVENGRIVGAEALLRWEHPKRGIVSPVEFIPLAERTGLILPLGNWVLESACKQLAAWACRKETANITVAVNISMRQMSHPDFVEQVLNTLESTGANPRNLRLELTESMFVEGFEETIHKMTALKAHGVRFSIDDFGTGFSSLSYLKRLPIDELKIERSFVHDIVEDASSGAIAESIILLSRALGLSVIAEGVETEAQRESLVRLGCSSFQGWLISAALPIEEFQSMCRIYPSPLA
jgi:diguanylate cyclase (GGDEF)-like protein/PAS domain S-box-containing protein